MVSPELEFVNSTFCIHNSEFKNVVFLELRKAAPIYYPLPRSLSAKYFTGRAQNLIFDN
jgi:hypothetical protein